MDEKTPTGFIDPIEQSLAAHGLEELIQIYTSLRSGNSIQNEDLSRLFLLFDDLAFLLRTEKPNLHDLTTTATEIGALTAFWVKGNSNTTRANQTKRELARIQHEKIIRKWEELSTTYPEKKLRKKKVAESCEVHIRTVERAVQKRRS